MVLKFDLSSIPANTQIEKAELSLYTFNNFIGYQGRVLPNGSKTLHVITTPWEEAKVTWQYPPEFEETPIDTSHEEGIKVWEHFDVTDYVNEVISGKRENLGLLIKQVPTFYYTREVPSTGVQIHSSEYGVVEMRPKLTLHTDKGTGAVISNVESILPQSGSFDVEVVNVKGQVVHRFFLQDVSKLSAALDKKCGSNHYIIMLKNEHGHLVHNFVYNKM